METVVISSPTSPSQEMASVMPPGENLIDMPLYSVTTTYTQDLITFPETGVEVIEAQNISTGTQTQPTANMEYRKPLAGSGRPDALLACPCCGHYQSLIELLTSGAPIQIIERTPPSSAPDGGLPFTQPLNIQVNTEAAKEGKLLISTTPALPTQPLLMVKSGPNKMHRPWCKNSGKSSKSKRENRKK